MAAFDSSETACEREGAFDHLIRRSERTHLGAMVCEARERAGLHQGELADRLGVPQSVLSKVEASYREVSVLELRVICAALDLSLTEFVGKLETAIQTER